MGVPNVFGDVTESRDAGADTSIPSWRLARGLRICAVSAANRRVSSVAMAAAMLEWR